MCGEHSTSNKTISAIIGLSPHTWGTPEQLAGRRGDPRFIPAYAENTVIHSLPYSATWVYPCIRGEHTQRKGGKLSSGGLSPHTRGTLNMPCVVVGGQRFIPAYAGNTQIFKARSYWHWVYPRIRGEHVTGVVVMEYYDGLSPHTRGTPNSRLPTTHFQRFIPAYAGNTVTFSPSCSACTVYPRIRGEHHANPD